MRPDQWNTFNQERAWLTTIRMNFLAQRFEITNCVRFQLRSAKLRLSGIQRFAPVHKWSQARFARRNLPLMQKARNCNSTVISVQHKFVFRIRLRQGSCLDQSQLNGVESLLLLILHSCESRTQAANSMQGSYKFGMPRNKIAIIIGEAQKLCSSVLFMGNSQSRCLDTAFESSLIPSAEATRPMHLISCSDSHLEASFAQTLKHLA